MRGKIKPFVKWAGGKGNLLNQIDKYYPIDLSNGKIDCYIEPFVGGGAVLINILQNYDVKNVYAIDINIDLINSYNMIKENVNELIDKLKIIEKEFLNLEREKRKEYFYDIRKQYNFYKIEKNEVSIEKAAQFIFLNRTCFNGLYRVNKSGDFNVPMGDYKNPIICDEENLRALSKLIQNVKFEYGDYQISQKYINRNTFIYFDPPYRPLNITSGFTSYTKEDFNDDNQRDLARYFKKINNYGAKIMLSNSNPKNINQNDNFFEEIYKGFHIHEVYAKRLINANWTGRGIISELLITNYNDFV